MKETLTVDDLKRVFIRAQDERGKWDTVDCYEATDKQFETWAKSRIEIQGNDAPWTLEERAHFCDMLWQNEALVILKKDTEL